MAGGAADCTYWIRRIARQSAVFEFQYNTPLLVQSVAKQLASALREHRGKGLSVGTMVAGMDANGPSIYYVDSEGSCIAGNCFSVGSGSNLAYAILDERLSKLKNESDATIDDAVHAALWSIRHATHRDGYSGGYINVFHINSTGHHHIVRRDAKALLIDADDL
jgi:20S proteasome subunit beta 5